MLRLGSRSKDEVVSQYSLESLEKAQYKKTSLHTESATYHHKMKDLEAVSHHRRLEQSLEESR